MATFVLVPGAGGDAWYWDRLVPELQRRGHEAVAVDLPAADGSAGLDVYADTVVAAAGDGRDVVLVAQSMGGLTAPLVCERLPVRLLVLVNPMVPAPGETGHEWWERTGHAEALAASDHGGDPEGDPDWQHRFFHDVPPDVVDEARRRGAPEQSGRPFEDPWPLPAWPDVPTRVVLGVDDRFFPPAFQRRVVRERLGFEPDELPGGHLLALSRPWELAERLEAYLRSVGATRPVR